MRVLKIPTIIDAVTMDMIVPASQITFANAWMLKDLEDPHSIRIHKVGTDKVIRASVSLDWLAEKEMFVKIPAVIRVDTISNSTWEEQYEKAKDVVINVENIIQLRPFTMRSRAAGGGDHFVLYMPNGVGKALDFHITAVTASVLQTLMTVQ